MTALKLSRVGADSVAGNPSLKVSRVAADGVTVASSALKLSRLAASGAVAVLLNPIADQTYDPAVDYTATITAVLTGGGVADDYTWRQVSGTPVTLFDADDHCTFTIPSVMPPANATVVVGVTCTVAGVTSPERQVTVTVFPQLEWWLDATRTFVGARPEVTL